MNENRLIINQVSGSSIVEYELDLYDTVSIPIVKSINDVANIAERKSSFTKTITLPGTKNNNDIFSSIFNLSRTVINNQTYNFAPDFNPNLKADCILYKNSIPQIIGYLQLVNIVELDEYQIEYEIIIIGRTANLFQDLGETKLNQLDLSAYNHEWTRDNIEHSWTAGVSEGYYYGLIDYGFDATELKWKVSNYYPQIYLKTIIDQIFSSVGRRYNSSFFDSALFAKFVVLATGKKLLLDETEVAVRQFLGNRTTNSTLATMSSGGDKMPFNNEVYDTTPPNGFNPTTYDFTNKYAGKYSIVTNLNLDLKNIGPINQLFNVIAYINVNGARIASVSVYSGVITAGVTVSVTKQLFTTNLFLNISDVVYIELDASNYFDLQWSLKSGSNFYNVANAEIVEGSTMELEKLLPDDITQGNFLSAVFKMFNLFVEPDPLDDKTLIIEPRDEFYSGTIQDLTQNVDVSKNITIEPLGALEYKEYLFEFAKDTDSLNEVFNKQYTSPYGTIRKDIVNDFVKDQYKTELIFAPSPLDESDNSNRIYTRILFLDSNGARVDKPSKLRILYNGGLIATDPVFQIVEETTGSITSYNEFPYVGHLDNVETPTFDLNFGMPQQLFYNAYKYTNNNLFNLYHKKGLEEITNADSKIVTYYIKLNELELSKLSFRTLYIIDKLYFRLYEVNYDSNSEEPAQIKFLQLQVAPEFVGETTDLNGGLGNIGTEPKPIYEQGFIRNGNTHAIDNDIFTYGDNNQIIGNAVLNNSNLNSIKGDLINIFGGQSNKVLHNNTTLIGCDEFETDREGLSVINNIIQPNYKRIIITSAQIQSLSTTPITVLDAEDGFWTELFDCYATIYFNNNTPVAYNSHKIHFEYALDGSTISEIDNGIMASTSAKKQRAVIFSDRAFKSEDINLHGNGSFGTSGNGELLLELHYKLHPIIR